MKEIGRLLGKYFKGDSGIWAIMLIFSIVSVAAIYSATGLLAYKYQGGHTAHYVVRHLSMLLLSWGVMFLSHRIKYTHYARGIFPLLVLVIVMLLYTLTIASVNGASRWVRILGLSFQPSELAKVVLVVFMARQLTKYRPVIKEKTAFWHIIWAPIIVCLLIFPENLSTAFLLMLTCFVLMMLGGVNHRYLWGTVGAGIAALMLIAMVCIIVPENKLPGRFSTWKHRVENYFSEGDDSTKSSADFQVMQAKIAVAGGGVTGKGPGNSTQRNFLPHPYSDYVYALIIEEYGAVGGLAILLLFLWFLRRGMRIARRCQGSFGSYLVLGLTFMLTVQAMVNMGVAVNLLPVTGQPLPFISMGGTSLLFTAMAVGMIQSVAKSVKEQESKAALEEKAEEENCGEGVVGVA